MQQQQQHSFHNQSQQQQHRPQPLLQNPPSNQQQQQQFPIQMLQQAVNNPGLSLQGQNSLGISQLAGVGNASQQNALDPWLALCAAALNPQTAAVQQQQQQQQQQVRRAYHNDRVCDVQIYPVRI